MFQGAFTGTALIAFLLLYAQAVAGGFARLDIPQTIPGVTTVDAEQLIDLVSGEPDLVLIDSRIETDRIHGYIEGSVSLPDIATSCMSLKTHVPTVEEQVLFYCNGIKCGRSVRAVRIAKLCGYKHLYWFKGGFEEWQQKGFPYLRE